MDAGFFAFHGLYPQERVLGGKFSVGLSVEIELGDSPPPGTIEKATDYERLYRIIAEEMAEPRDLIEAVAAVILERTRALHPGAMISVTITKANPAGLFAGNGSASVTLS
jgi:dihydroneopterin aldolase